SIKDSRLSFTSGLFNDLKHLNLMEETKMKSTRKRTRRGLAVLVLAVFCLSGYLASTWSHSTVDAAAARAARVALDDAAARFQAEPTVENAAILNDARIAFSRAVAADPSYLKANPHPTLALSARIQIDAFHKMKSELTPAQRKIGSRLLISAMKRENRLPLGLESLRTSVKLSKAGNAVVDITVTSRIPGLKALDRFNPTVKSAVGRHIRAE